MMAFATSFASHTRVTVHRQVSRTRSAPTPPQTKKEMEPTTPRRFSKSVRGDMRSQARIEFECPEGKER